MLFTTLKVADTEYKLRLNVRALINLEKRLGKNPLDIFMKVKDSELPKLEDMMIVFHESLQAYQHGKTLDDAYDIYDKYIEDGGTYTDFIPVVMDIYKVSGLFKEEKTAKGKTAKNA